MEKDAVDLLNLALLSLLAGGGAYGGMRLAKDLPNEGKKPAKPTDQLDITLPASRMPKVANDTTTIGSYFWPTVAGAGGLAGGFLGASSIYEHLKKKQLEKQMQQTQGDYMSALQQAHQKVASIQTPHTDKFLEGLFSKIGQVIEKEGWVQPEFLGGEGPIDVLAHQTKNLGSHFFNSEPGKMTGAAMLLAALASGGATYGIAKKLDKDKEDIKNQSTLPTDVNLHIAR